MRLGREREWRVDGMRERDVTRERKMWLWIQVVGESNLDSIWAWNTEDCNGEKMVKRGKGSSERERERKRIMRERKKDHERVDPTN